MSKKTLTTPSPDEGHEILLKASKRTLIYDFFFPPLVIYLIMRLYIHLEMDFSVSPRNYLLSWDPDPSETALNTIQMRYDSAKGKILGARMSKILPVCGLHQAFSLSFFFFLTLG